MIILLWYYGIGVFVAINLILAAYLTVGSWGIYEAWQEEFGHFEHSVLEANVYGVITILVVVPVAYGYLVMKYLVQEVNLVAAIRVAKKKVLALFEKR